MDLRTIRRFYVLFEIPSRICRESDRETWACCVMEKMMGHQGNALLSDELATRSFGNLVNAVENSKKSSPNSSGLGIHSLFDFHRPPNPSVFLGPSIGADDKVCVALRRLLFSPLNFSNIFSKVRLPCGFPHIPSQMK